MEVVWRGGIGGLEGGGRERAVVKCVCVQGGGRGAWGQKIRGNIYFIAKAKGKS